MLITVSTSENLIHSISGLIIYNDVFISAQFAVTSSRAMLNALKVTQMPKDINLACLEMILVSDGYQPCEFLLFVNL